MMARMAAGYLGAKKEREKNDKGDSFDRTIRRKRMERSKIKQNSPVPRKNLYKYINEVSARYTSYAI